MDDDGRYYRVTLSNGDRHRARISKKSGGWRVWWADDLHTPASDLDSWRGDCVTHDTADLAEADLIEHAECFVGNPIVLLEPGDWFRRTTPYFVEVSRDAPVPTKDDPSSITEFDEYQRIRHAGSNRDHEPMHLRLAHIGLGLTGEAGEVADAIKKHLFHGKPLNKEALILELGDVLWYIQFAATTLGVRLSDIATANDRKLRERYPNGFSEAVASKLPTKHDE